MSKIIPWANQNTGGEQWTTDKADKVRDVINNDLSKTISTDFDPPINDPNISLTEAKGVDLKNGDIIPHNSSKAVSIKTNDGFKKLVFDDDERFTLVTCWVEKDGNKRNGYNTGAITVSKLSTPGHYKINHNYGRNITVQLTSISDVFILGVSSIVDTHFEVRIKDTNGNNVDGLFFVEISK